MDNQNTATDWDVDEFNCLVHHVVSDPEDLAWAVGRAMGLSSINAIIGIYKDGWNGEEGRFARVVARCLSQIE